MTEQNNNQVDESIEDVENTQDTDVGPADGSKDIQPETKDIDDEFTSDEDPSPVDDVDPEHDAKMEAQLIELESGELPLYNSETMRPLLEYLVSQDQYVGEFNPTVGVEIVESMLASIKSVEGDAQGGLVGSNHTSKELLELNRRLWRKILASQFQRNQLSRKEIQANYVVMDEPKVIVTKDEFALTSYLSSCMAVINKSPVETVLQEGEWTNSLSHNDRRIGVAVVSSHRDPVKNIRSRLNLTTEAASHLPHSGLVVKLSSGGSVDLALINDNLVANRINNSLSTYGTGLDITGVYEAEILVEHAWRQLVETNVGDLSKETFEDNLSVLDLELLYLALATSLYPTGYELIRQCVSDECKNTDKILINPRRSYIIRKDRLTEGQRGLLARNFARSDISVLRDYRDSLSPNVTKYIPIDDEGTFLKLQTPVFSTWKRVGHRWLNYLGDKSLELMMGTQDEAAREKFIQQTMEKTEIMGYAHWIHGVYTRDENGEYIPNLVRLNPHDSGVTTNAVTVADTELDDFLVDISLNDELHRKIVKGISDYIRDSTLSVMGLSKSKCTKCGEPHHMEGEEDENEIIVYNAGEVFFTLLLQKTGGRLVN